jgi:GNAT superfamily N-acetyltransferase
MKDSIKQLTTEQEWLEAFPVINELRKHLDEDAYLSLVHEMDGQGYQLFGLYNEGRIVAVTGVIILTNLYNGRHVYVYDLVTKATERSNGYGEILLSYIHRWARENGCEKAVLSSGLQRHDAHRFYERKMGYEKVSYVFTKSFE